MNTITPCVALSFVWLCTAGVRAADTSSSTIVRDYTDVVAPADQQAYSETSAFFEIMPAMSHMPKKMPPTSAFIEVTYFKLKPGHEAMDAFMAAAKKIAAAAEKSNWTVNYMIGQVREADEGAPDFILVIPANSWAEVGKDPDPSVWKMVENVYGKEIGQAIRKSVNDAMQNQSTHVDSYSAELTYMAASQ